VFSEVHDFLIPASLVTNSEQSSILDLRGCKRYLRHYWRETILGRGVRVWADLFGIRNTGLPIQQKFKKLSTAEIGNSLGGNGEKALSRPQCRLEVVTAPYRKSLFFAFSDLLILAPAFSWRK
jgi:hypothetical protein